MDNQHNDRFPHKEQQATPEARSPNTEMADPPAFPTITAREEVNFLELSPDALVIVDSEGMIVLVNELAASLFGYGQDELIGQPLEVLLPGRFHTAHVTHRARYIATPHRRPMGVGLDLWGKRRDGSEFPVDISLRPLLVEQALHVVGAIRDITAQRRLERERIQQAERLSLQSTLINLARDAILVRDPINRILSWNRGAEELYGWTEQEALGRVTQSLLKTRFPGDPAEIEAQLAQGDRWEGELVHNRSDGRSVVVESRQVLVRDEQGTPIAILEINRDITERRRLEQAQTMTYVETLAQRTFLQEMLDALPSGVSVVHGREAHLVLTNRAAASIWGATWSPEQSMREFLEMHHIRIVDSQGQPCPPHAWATMRALLHGETVLQYQEIIRQPSGTSLPILVNAVPLVSPYWQSMGTPEQSGGDESPQRDEPLALVIHQDVRLLKEAESFKDEFIGIAAHELRQPLAALKGAVGTLVLQTARGHGPHLAEWQEALLQDLDQATDRLTDLTEDLLDVSRLQAGRLSLQRTPTNLVSLARRVVERVQRSTTRHQLTFSPQHSYLEAAIDPQRIEQVLTNLLTNAIKYSPQGGPVKVMLETDAAAQTVEICIRDCGMGIPRYQQAQIFGRFVRGDNAQAAGISGTGLGLYLCRALVEQHEGQLWFESVEGEGSTFFFILPLVTAPQQNQASSV